MSFPFGALPNIRHGAHEVGICMRPEPTCGLGEEAEAIVMPLLPLSLPKLKFRLVAGVSRRFSLWCWKGDATTVIQRQFCFSCEPSPGKVL